MTTSVEFSAEELNDLINALLTAEAEADQNADNWEVHDREHRYRVKAYSYEDLRGKIESALSNSLRVNQDED